MRSTIAPGSTPYVERHIDEALAFGAIEPTSRILDAGCGMGRHAFLLAGRGLQVEGLELSPHLVERMREQDRFGIPVHCADMADPPPALDNRFEAVVGFFILHHVPDLAAAFRGVARVLRPGGRTVFVEPNPFNPLYYAQIAITPGMRWSAEKGMTRMRPAPMFAALAEAGLIRPAIRRFGFFPPFLRNRSWGGPAESIFERIPPFRPFLPFQLFRAEKP